MIFHCYVYDLHSRSHNKIYLLPFLVPILTKYIFRCQNRSCLNDIQRPEATPFPRAPMQHLSVKNICNKLFSTLLDNNRIENL